MHEPTDSKIHFIVGQGKHTLLIDNLPVHFAIRIDWTEKIYNILNLETQLLDDHVLVNQLKQSHEKFSKVNIKSYLNSFQTQLHKIYPTDKYSIFSTFWDKDTNHHEGKEDIRHKGKSWNVLKANLLRIFSPMIFGFDYISHGHADHCPLTGPLPECYISNGKNQKKSTTESHHLEKIRYYPFPILTTSRNLQILETRFSCRLISFFDWYDGLVSHQQKVKQDDLIPFNSWSQAETQKALNYLEYLRKRYCKFFQNKLTSKKSDKTSVFFPIEAKFEAWLIEQLYFHPIFIDDFVFWLIPSGHVIGSCALCISKKSTILGDAENLDGVLDDSSDFAKPLKCDFVYIGETNPIFRGHCLIPPLIQSKNIVLDMLYGDPRKIFPNFTDELTRLKEWILNNIKNRNIVIFCRPLGKPQLILDILTEIIENRSIENPFIPLIVPNDFLKLFEAMIPDSIINNLRMEKVLLNKSSATRKKIKEHSNFILLENPGQRNSSSFINFFHKYQPLIAEISGWCGEVKYREEHPADAFLEISDHLPIREVTSWLKKNKISNIWITNTASNLPIKYMRENLDSSQKCHLLDNFSF